MGRVEESFPFDAGRSFDYAASPSLRMTEALPLPGELRACAAGGRRSKLAISAAVGECKEMRKPAAFSGHRKVEETGRASVPQPSENTRKSVSPQRFPRKARRETLVSLPGTLSWLRGASETSAVEESFPFGRWKILYSSLRAGRSLQNASPVPYRHEAQRSGFGTEKEDGRSGYAVFVARRKRSGASFTFPRILAAEPSEAGLPRQRRCSGGSELLSLRESETIRSLHRRQIGHVGSHWSSAGPRAVALGS